MSTTETKPDQLKLLTFDEKLVDRIVIAFAGQYELNIDDADDRAIFDELTLGKVKAFRVAGVVSARKVARKESGQATVTSTATVTIDALLPDPFGAAQDLDRTLKESGVSATFEVPGRDPVHVGADDHPDDDTIDWPAEEREQVERPHEDLLPETLED